MYILASMVLFPTEPGPPEGVYQKGFGSLMVFGPSVSTEPEKVALRSAVPHELPNTKAPPFWGISNTFIYPSHDAPGSTLTVAAVAFASPISIEQETTV